MRLYCAVIEWPDVFFKSPELIVVRDEKARDLAVIEAVREMADALADGEWRAILNGFPDPIASVTWKEWIEFHFDGAKRAPGITYYTKEV